MLEYNVNTSLHYNNQILFDGGTILVFVEVEVANYLD